MVTYPPSQWCQLSLTHLGFQLLLLLLQFIFQFDVLESDCHNLSLLPVGIGQILLDVLEQPLESWSNVNCSVIKLKIQYCGSQKPYPSSQTHGNSYITS